MVDAAVHSPPAGAAGPASVRDLTGCLSAAWRRIDPRLLQIACLGSLLAYGLATGLLHQKPLHVAAAMAGAFGAQAICSIMLASQIRLLSALITTLSLSLLLRTDAAWAMALAGAIATGSKFTLRVGEKHIFNPANAGVVAMLILGATVLPGVAWTSPGQWGSAFLFALALAGAGFLVTARAARVDAALAFLLTFAALSIARALWLGDPLSIPFHRLQSGALILFSYFMITDPMTTPDGKRARIVFAMTVAAIAYLFSHHLHISDGPFYALAICCAFRPLIEAFDPAPAYRWPADAIRHPSSPESRQGRTI